MLLDAERSQLLVIDLQARLMPAIHDGEAVLRNVRILLQSARQLGVPVTVTEQYPKGLGATVPQIHEMLTPEAPILAKTTFSAARDPGVAERVAALRGNGRNQLVICGTEAHICVLQSALEFRTSGLDVFVVADAVSSRSSHSVSAACARLLHAGCQWVTTEMSAFEWMGKAATDDFRALAPLFK
ncbi:isochorismatase family protein [Microvirga lotononidis]|uniref:Nicotinamidase-like amidase n=1 Tax=Microvirga lotononidis TaxID=864069 RepID=I4YNH9_9HYPH|nr:isochorismatase family protein [Microvirga lotononidis]EIM25521.1 nicotinamidase-like amidase [Microvirga lotononidis]WQO26169.1 isochorismatase family protein [Microvirga lotononidis]